MQSHVNVRVTMSELINELMKSFRSDRAITGTRTSHPTDYRNNVLRQVQELQRNLLLTMGSSIEELRDASSLVPEAYGIAVKLMRFDIDRHLYRYAAILDRLPYYPPDDWSVGHLVNQPPEDLAFELKLHALKEPSHE